ncbi:alpha-hydroxy acid oxidase [Cupriavidus basilensis]|uniref:Alpha-hydroxy acid oxidase n=1 Tax=Cupriavidus basilensis TaxID=68895 RepID=A0ABT6APE3_9BURK|nr:alpha-hydroxy acid oxidase [Cupriavidus basilensis]MDF3834452.1 alpha-hydroxy acid oxidase [Cupriavidus basilensis]
MTSATDAAASTRPTNRGFAAPLKQASRALQRILSLDDFEHAARRRLPRPIYGYIAGAAEDNRSLQENRAAFHDYALTTRVLVDVSRRTQSVELFGKTYASPFGIAPMGLSALSAYRGDIVQARAARAAGIPMVLSGSSLIRLEDVFEAAPDAWFQAYVPGDAARIDALLDRVRATGCRTLVVTVDIPVAGNRENNVRSGFSTPLRPSLRLAYDGITRPQWLVGTFARTLLRHGMPHFENSFAERGAPILSANVLRDFSARDHLDWSHLERIRRRWKGVLIVKGILSAQDAVLARDRGADGIVVSNHGGRQLDGAVAPLRVLPGIVAAVGDLPVMMDGGIRRGTDVVKALALGAKLVFVGRPFNYAASVAGEAGVTHAINLLRDEVDRNMAMLGVSQCAGLDPAVLYRR